MSAKRHAVRNKLILKIAEESPRIPGTELERGNTAGPCYALPRFPLPSFSHQAVYECCSNCVGVSDTRELPCDFFRYGTG